jgi:hypothetical protein
MPTEPITVEDAMKESASVFEGHPAEESGDKKGDDKVEKPEEKKSDEKLEKPDEKLEKPEEKKPAFKYVSQEEAEKGAKEAEKLIGKKSDEAKQERGRADDLQKQLNDALVKIAKSTEKSEAVVPTSADRMKTLLDQVNALDPEDEDYHSKVAKIWGTREDAIQADIGAKVKDALDVYDKKVKEEKSKVDSELSTQKKIVFDADVAGTEAGLDMKKGSGDSELFWAFADKAPEGSIEDQIKWTVDKIKEIKTAIAAPGIKEKEKDLEAEKKAKANQEQNSVLERGGHKPAEKVVPAVPLGLADAFTQIERRI